jgi:hypothetical protein
MKASVFYRIAAVLLLLFAVGHTLGFRQSDPKWGVDAVLGTMRSIHFEVQGFNRTYWDLFVAAGLSVGVFYLFAAVLAWQLGGLSAETLPLTRGVAWAFRPLLCRYHDRELEIPLRGAYRVLGCHYCVFDCGCVAFIFASRAWRGCRWNLTRLPRSAVISDCWISRRRRP